MRKSTVLFLLFVILAGIGIVGYKFILQPRFQEDALERGSDAERVKATISVAGDNYFGYWFLNSKKFRQLLIQQGYAPKWFNDNGDYKDRHEKLARGDYNIMVLPVSSYLEHGRNTTPQYPGVIVVALSDSKGADNVVALRDRVVPQGTREPTINDLNNSALKVCMTENSPSSFLLNTAIVHFDLNQLKASKSWRVGTDGSTDAFKRFSEQDPLKRQCDVAVLWEPDVSRALALPGVVSVYGSHQISQMIIDVFVVNRDFIRDHPERVIAFFEAYYETLQYYAAHREEMLSEMESHPDFKPLKSPRSAVENVLSRIAWFDREDNCRDWFNIPLSGVIEPKRSEKIIDTITLVTDVMVEVGDLSGDPLKGNPYIITADTTSDSSVLRKLCSLSGIKTTIGATVPVNLVFKSLSDEEWVKLKVIGTMRILPILFPSGTSNLTFEGRTVVDEAAIALIHNFPQYRILVKGHTAASGDEGANVILSQQRADAVRDYLISVKGMDPNRLKAVGIGSKEQLPRQKGEGELSYRSRLPRVEFVLLEDKP